MNKEKQYSSLLKGLGAFNRTMLNFFNHRLLPFGISAEKLILLIELMNPCETITQMAYRIGSNRSTLSRNLIRLRKMNLVEEIIGKGDKKARKNVLTENGRKLVYKATPAFIAAECKINELIGKERIEKFLLELNEFRNIISLDSKD